MACTHFWDVFFLFFRSVGLWLCSFISATMSLTPISLPRPAADERT
jgi:hypothetical protein